MENEIFDKIDKLLATKAYDALTSEEKLWVYDQVGGQQEYDRLRALTLNLGVEQEMKVSPGVKTSLIEKMKTNQQPIWLTWLTYKVPTYVSVLSVLLLALLLFLFQPVKEVTVEKIVMIPSEKVVDTVMVRSKPDTIFIERTVKVPVYLSKKQEPALEEKPPRKVSQEKSLADQGELRSLLLESE